MTAAAPPGMPELLHEVSLIGPYFAVTAGPAPAGARPLADLYDTGESSPVSHGIARVAARLGTHEPRVAASTLQFGIAARLWSVALGCAALGRTVPDLAPGTTHWRLPASGPIDLWAPDPATGDEPSDDLPRLADSLHDIVTERHLAPFGRAVRAATPVAPRLLWGNAASALAGAARVLHTSLHGTRPEAAQTALDLAGLLTERGALRGTGHWAPEPPYWRRGSCCLYYRTPGGGLCGSCPLTTDPSRRRRTESETPR
ncbi:MAG TPA: (2Fe-2S)-binding protein [Yinghuangia sp.]|nr:(2Fe-2S)-binding protein [Yinghuangia sp.]